MPVAIVTNYQATGNRNSDGSAYGGNRIAGPYRYPAGTVIRFYLLQGPVEAVVHDREAKDIVKHQLHFDWPTRFFRITTGLPTRGGRIGTLEHVRFEVVKGRVKRHDKRARTRTKRVLPTW